MSTRSMVNMVALIGMPVAAARIADIEVEERHALGRHGDAHLLRQGLTHCGKAYAEEGGKCYSVSQDQSFRLWLGFFSCLTPSRVRFFSQRGKLAKSMETESFCQLKFFLLRGRCHS